MRILLFILLMIVPAYSQVTWPVTTNADTSVVQKLPGVGLTMNVNSGDGAANIPFLYFNNNTDPTATAGRFDNGGLPFVSDSYLFFENADLVDITSHSLLRRDYPSGTGTIDGSGNLTAIAVGATFNAGYAHSVSNIDVAVMDNTTGAVQHVTANSDATGKIVSFNGLPLHGPYTVIPNIRISPAPFAGSQVFLDIGPQINCNRDTGSYVPANGSFLCFYPVQSKNLSGNWDIYAAAISNVINNDPAHLAHRWDYFTGTGNNQLRVSWSYGQGWFCGLSASNGIGIDSGWGTATCESFVVSGSGGGIIVRDRNGDGSSGVLYRVNGVTRFYDSGFGDVWTYDNGGNVNFLGGIKAGGVAGLSTTKTVRNLTGTCTLIFTKGLLTGGTC